MSFLGELKKRKVIRVAIAYAVVAWALIEIVSTIEEPLGLPGWTDTFVIVLFAAGFPLAIVLSWMFDLTSKGIVRTPGAEEAAEGPALPPAGGPAAGDAPASQPGAPRREWRMFIWRTRSGRREVMSAAIDIAAERAIIERRGLTRPLQSLSSPSGSVGRQ